MQKLSDLKNRLLISIVIIAFVFLLINFSYLVYLKIASFVVISCLGCLAGLEFINILKQKQIVISKIFFLIFIISEIFSFFIFSQYEEFKILPIFVFLVFVIYLFLSNFKQIENSILRISTAALGFLYIAIPFGMLFPILYMQNQDGRYWIFYLLVVTKFTDIGGYFGGKLFGKRKLAVHISSNKTIFGSVSGFFFALLGSSVFLFFSNPNVFDFNLTMAISLGIILSGFSQIGDLSESLLKRDAKIKDSSSIPGIGGILDMVDSLMLNIPILYCYLLG